MISTNASRKAENTLLIDVGPSTSTTDENLKKTEEIVPENRKVKIREPVKKKNFIRVIPNYLYSML